MYAFTSRKNEKFFSLKPAQLLTANEQAISKKAYQTHSNFGKSFKSLKT
jgi:hypothetical protein